MKVSILLLTFNEERNLPRMLGAVDWCDDIIAVDSGSTDRSIEIMRAAGVRVLHRKFDDFANQRNFGLVEGQPKHEWVLHLDADEVVTPAFRAKLDALVPPDGIDAYHVPSKLMLDESWLRYAGMYPTYQVRLGHRTRLRFRQVGHGQREDLPPERVATFDEPYLHYNFSAGLAAWLRRHIRYAEDEARYLVSVRDGTAAGTASGGATGLRRRLKALSAYLPATLRPLARFFYIIVIKRGFLDGRAGFLYALMLAVYEGMTGILAAEEMRRRAASGGQSERTN
jgi:glycosyltransferase involved in cell wall biosynthesis